jgi:hypothetical protein
MYINWLLFFWGFLADLYRAAALRWAGGRGSGHEFRCSRQRARHASVALLWLAVAATPVLADPRSDLEQARHDLAISEQVLARVTGRIEAARSDAATAPEQRQRLDAYLARVRELVELNRERVRTLAQTVDSLPAGAASAGTLAGATPKVATNAEEIAALEQKLGGSLAEFDQLLLEEARRAQVRAPDGRSGSAGGYGGSTAAAKTSKGSGAGSGAPGGTAKNSGNTVPQQPPTEAGSAGGRIKGGDPGTAGATAARPPDVGDGSDDDIVARQIRRLAESEPDPALREKLWDEYRKYKQGGQG